MIPPSGDMELGPAQGSGQTAGSVVQEAVERALVELVRVRQMEVERLEQELDELRVHATFLFQSFSVPTFPPGYNPDPKRFEDTPELLEGLHEDNALAPAVEDNHFPRTGLQGFSGRGSPAEPSQELTVGPHEEDVELLDYAGDNSKDGAFRGSHLRNLKEEAYRKSLTSSLNQAVTPPSLYQKRVEVADDADDTLHKLSSTKNPTKIAYTPLKRRKNADGADNNATGEQGPLTEVLRQGPGKILKQAFTPFPHRREEAKFVDEADNEGEVRAKTPKHTEKPQSSSSPSHSPKGRKGIEWADDNAVDILKDAIRKERRGLKSPAKSPAKPFGKPLSPAKAPPKPETISSSSGSSSSEEESSSGSEESSSESEDSVPDSRSKSVKGMKSKGLQHGQPVESSSEEASSSSSSGSETSSKKKLSPVKVKRSASGGSVPTTTWQPKKKALSSSSDSGESSSSSDDDTVRKKWHSQPERARAVTASRAASATSLSSDASPEDLFDWTILGLQGPWLPSTCDETTLEILEPKDQSPLPFKFSSMATYVAVFQKLIAEEAKAILHSEWEQYQAEQDPNSQPVRESSSGSFGPQDTRGLSTQWQPRSMMQTTGDPFHYIEAEWVEGPNLKLDAGEFLCMVVPKTNEVKALAIVNYEDRFRAPLLRMRTAWDSSLGQCVLLKLCNMVTLRRMFLAVSTISNIFSPLQQQVLDPMANIKYMIPPPTSDDAVDDNSNLKLKSETLRNFNARKILNTMQLLTVSGLLYMRQGFQLVQGPPGTGKTSTIVGMVSTLMIEEPGVRVLVCAPSNAALDEIAARLMHRMLDKAGNPYSPMDGALVRFGSKRIMHPLVQSISLDSLALRLSSSSNRSRPWIDILDGASVVCATLSGCGNTIFDELENMFDVLIIDEAAQAVEAEVLIALKRVRGRCVMVGDPRQLPATVFQRPGTAFGRSLFERFQEGGLPVHLLTTQYRMHPSISFYPSHQFYNGALKNSLRTGNMQSIFDPAVCDGTITIHGCRFKLGHYSFMDVGWGIEHEEIVGHSRANFEEALVVCNVVEGIVKGLLSGLKPNLGVITPYIAQRGVIEDQLESRGIDGTACEVNTVDGFQGREKDVIVLSCVRAMADRGLGFVSDERRMNVALTRAKYSLIIVGHAETLQRWSPSWGALIDDARKRGCYQVLTNNKIQDSSTKNWQQRHTTTKDAYAMDNERGYRLQVSKKGKGANGVVSKASKEDGEDNGDGSNPKIKKSPKSKKFSPKAEKNAKAEDDFVPKAKIEVNGDAAEEDYGNRRSLKALKNKTPGAGGKTNGDVNKEEDHSLKKRSKLVSKKPRAVDEVNGDMDEDSGGEACPAGEKGKEAGKAGSLKSKGLKRDLKTAVLEEEDENRKPKLKRRREKSEAVVEEQSDDEGFGGKKKKKKVAESLTETPPVKKKKKLKVADIVKKKKKVAESPAVLPVAEKKKTPVVKKKKVAISPPESRTVEKVKKKKKLIVRDASPESLAVEKKKKLKVRYASPESPFAMKKGTGVSSPRELPVVPRKDKKEKEVIVYEVTSTPIDGGHIRWGGTDPKTLDKTEVSAEPLTDPLPRGTGSWRNMRAQELSRGWFPKAQSEHVEPPPQTVRQPFPGMDPAGNQKGFNHSEEYALAIKEPQWRNSCGRGGRSNYSTLAKNGEDMYRDNYGTYPSQAEDYYEDQPDNWGNPQQNPKPKKQWKNKPKAAQKQPSKPRWTAAAKKSRGQSSVARRPN